MPVDEFLEVLRVHLRSFGVVTPGFIAVDRDAVEQQVGADRMPAFDAYVADHGGEIVRVTAPASKGQRAGARFLRVGRSERHALRYELPRELFDRDDSPPGEEPVNSA